MGVIIDRGFVSWDAAGGGGAVDVSADLMLEASFLTDSKSGVAFTAFGGSRNVEFPGLIAATTMTAQYRVPTDTSDVQYNDAIAAWDGNLLQTFVFRTTSAAVGVTNHQYTVTGYLADGPIGGIVHGEFIKYMVNLNVHSVVFTDGTTTYTWN